MSKVKQSAPNDRAVARSRARLGAVQALYQMELAETDLSDILAEYGAGEIARGISASDAGSEDFEYFSNIISGVVKEQRTIDPKINGCLAEGWRLERLDSILRAILRAGTYELTLRPDVPARVVINEYLDLTHAFFEADESKFVNGVLDRLARELRAAEFVGQS